MFVQILDFTCSSFPLWITLLFYKFVVLVRISRSIFWLSRRVFFLPLHYFCCKLYLALKRSNLLLLFLLLKTYIFFNSSINDVLFNLVCQFSQLNKQRFYYTNFNLRGMITIVEPFHSILRGNNTTLLNSCETWLKLQLKSIQVNFLLLDQDINQFLVQVEIKFKISYLIIRNFTN